MWYSKYTFFSKEEGLKGEIPDNYFLQPYTEEEFKIISNYTGGKTVNDFQIPPYLQLPEEYRQLLAYSNGGGIINGEREFGFLSPEGIREMYIAYGFLIWAPDLLPIAFNGGGKFYVYDFSNQRNDPSVLLVPAGCIGDDDSYAFLGNTLDDVLGKTTNVEEELNKLYPQRELSATEKKRADLNRELQNIKQKKESGEIDLKTFLKAKQDIALQMKNLEL
ncbi:SMI1 / KNR4 family (SUKH-1) [Chitinophaga sp. YR627]|uniref:SMI1/KNR4 family protein n=1 Tax=Chitinophaga sp. YR627 TaxID=1881041 RepID=UPI0008EB19DD|nr:SMI1/KNR4 family protein [Chitinophaga sp. YR627]SFM63246.1 SMI1 / KNR4 family (SUKH-1) [Chitinophaga sp. YR627]